MAKHRAGGIFIGALVALTGCASLPETVPAPAVPAPQRIAGFELHTPLAAEVLKPALSSWIGRQPDAAAQAEIAEQVRAVADWLEWTDIRVQVASGLGAGGDLRVEVSAAAPAPLTSAPLAESVPVLQMTPALGMVPPASRRDSGMRLEPALDDSFMGWLQSRHRVLIDAQERRLYFKRNASEVVSYAVAVGTARTPTPQGEYTVESIGHKPAWYPPASIRREWAAKGKELPAVVPPGRGNPLGEYFVRLQDGIGIHGTNQPRSIGRAASHGCVRMHDGDVKQLASELKTGDGIWVVHQRVRSTAQKETRNEVLWGMRAHAGVQSTAR